MNFINLTILTLLVSVSFTFAQNKESFLFTENLGQWEGPFQYKTKIPSGEIYFSKEGTMIKLTDEAQLANIYEEESTNPVKEHAIKVSFVGAQTNYHEGKNPVSTKNNYFFGNDRSKWRSGVQSYEELSYIDLYSSVDMIYYTRENRLKYDFIVKPGGDPNDIQLEYEGADALFIDNNGRLNIKTSLFDIQEAAPYCYQIIDGKEIEVASAFKLDGNVLKFELGAYDLEYDLILDPDLIYCTYSGTSNSSAIVSADASTYDSQNNLVLVAGSTLTGYPPTVGAYQTTPTAGYGNFSITITKIDPSTGNTIFATYLSGDTKNSGFYSISYGLSVKLDESDNLYLLGHTNTTDFPIVGAYQSSNAGKRDYILSKLSADGSSLLASTYLGGAEDEAGEYSEKAATVFLDGSDVIIVGTTKSTDFPTTAGVLQATKASATDLEGVICKLNTDLSALTWGTYYGGSGEDVVTDLKVLSSGNIVVCGNSTSTDLVGLNGVNNANQGGQDGFALQLSSDGSSVIAGTYLGTTALDKAKFIHVDEYDGLFVLGVSHGNYPTTAGAYSDNGKSLYYYVHKLNANCNVTHYATRIGGNSGGTTNDLVPTAFGIDACQNIYFTGSVDNGGFPTTSDAYSTLVKGLFMCKFTTNANALEYASYFGGTVSDSHFHEGSNCQYNDKGRLFHTECTKAMNYPTTFNGNMTTNGVNYDAASFVFDFYFEENLIGPGWGGQDTLLCHDSSFEIDPGIVGSNLVYLWNTGETDATITVNTAGMYDVMVTNGCDTIYDTLNVILVPPFDINLGDDIGVCQNELITLSVGDPYDDYDWSTGESTATINVFEGEYWLEVTDSNGCTAMDTILITYDSIAIDLGANHFMCDGDSFTINPTIYGTNLDYLWSDGSTNMNLTVFTEGMYYLTISNDDSCSLTDSVYVTVYNLPNADAGSDLYLCNGDSATLSGGGVDTYVWSGGIIDGVPFMPGVGVVNYELEVTDANGCVNNDTVMVTVYNNPTISAGSNANICSGDSITLIASGTDSLVWENGTENGGYVFPPIGTTEYVVIGVDTNGCASRDTVEITVNALPVIEAGLDIEICENELVTLNGSGGVSYSWDNGVNDGVAFIPDTGMTIYHVVGIDANGCQNEDSLSITVHSNPNATIIPPGVFCPFDTAQVLNAIVSGGVWSGSGIVDANSGVFDPTIAGPGNHPIVYELTDVNGCYNADTVTITVTNNVDAEITSDGPWCASVVAVNLEANIDGGTWFGNGIIDSINGVFSPENAGNGIHLITYIIGGGCGDTTSMNFEVWELPNIEAGADASICYEDSVVFSGSGGESYIWDNSILDGVYFVPDTGIVVYHVTGTDVNGCSNVDSLILTVFDNPDATITTPDPICPFDAPFFLETVDAGGIWSGNGIIDASTGEYSPENIPTGVHQVIYEITDINGCFSSDTTWVTINDTVKAEILSANAWCMSDPSISLVASLPGGIWDGVGIVDDQNGEFSPALAGVGNHTITYVMPGTCGDTAFHNVEIYGLPMVNLGWNVEICLGDSILLNGSGEYTFEWSPNVPDSSYVSPVTGVHDYILTATDTNGCINKDTLEISVHDLPAIDLKSDTAICQGTEYVLLQEGNANYLWNHGVLNGVAFVPVQDSLWYVLTAIDTNGCVNVDSIQIQLNSLPNAAIIAVDSICFNREPFQLNAVDSGGIWSGNGIVNEITGVFSPENAGVGLTEVYYQVENEFACKDSSVIGIEVLAIPDAYFATNSPYCEEDEIENIIPNTLGGAFSGVGFLDTVGTFDPSIPPIGDSFLTYHITNENGCSNEYTNIITVQPTPDLLNLQGGNYCLNETNKWVIGESDAEINWYADANLTSFLGNGDSLNLSIENSGLIIVYAVADNDGMCFSETESVEVNVSGVEGDFTADNYEGESPMTVNFDNYSSNAVAYYWDFGNGDSSLLENPTTIYEEGGYYEVVLIVENENGCMDTIKQYITVEDISFLEIPNLFTPNGDGANDTYNLHSDHLVEIHCEVYNRWGNFIYAWNAEKGGWDGRTAAGKECPTGTYYCVIYAKGVDGLTYKHRLAITLMR